MKKMSFTLIFLCLVSFSYSQSIQTIYDTSSLLQIRTGEWRYANGLDTVRVFLRYHRCFDGNRNIIKDRLWGWHEYKNGNTVIQSNYANRFMTLPYNITNINYTDFSILLRFDWSDELPYARGLTGTIYDLNYNNIAHNLKINFVVNKQGQTLMFWNQSYAEVHEFNGPVLNMTLPTYFVLQKL